MQLRGKTALVTGGAKRVGRQIALKLAQKGVHILIHYNHSRSEAESTATEIHALGVKATLFQADLTQPSQIQTMLEEIHRQIPSVDILVNSASAYYKTPLKEVKESDWDLFLDANLKAPFLLSKDIGLKMAGAAGGKIINIADWSGFRPYRDFAPYCASKGGLITLTKSLARDLAPKVLVNAIAPGPILPPPDMGQAEKEAIAKTTALGRWGAPEDIANATTFLLENDFINGSVLVVDGGRSIV
ncbi:MAG: SDR family oxidoreductase [Candidatus Omnitrophica bacterium]|nr:SDR family oxidoreductase [Candidatus Omnitrophota bacterium]